MNKLVVALSASTLFLAGCSSTSSAEPKYDEVELIQYQACLDKYSSSSRAIFNPAVDVEASLKFCKYLLPVKK